MKTNIGVLDAMLIHLIAAARPNFMKIAPLYHALEKEDGFTPVIVHTGQHYDLNMSEAFFTDLHLPSPHIHLGVGSGSHAEQTGNVMIAYEKVVVHERPDLVIVVGDVNSTLACTLAAVKAVYPGQETGGGEAQAKCCKQNCHRPVVAHLEAGLRSFDLTMPEEINRIATDRLADILWTPSTDGDENLINEGVAVEKIERVGNIMIDSIEMMRDTIEKQNTLSEFGLIKRQFGIVTLHRPANVDNPELLSSLCYSLVKISKRINLIFPVHPRTRKNLNESGLIDVLEKAEGIILSEPLNYNRFMSLVINCRVAITDSGGIQEETTYLGIPCLTIRPNTERPITIAQGTNRLCSIQDFENKIISIFGENIGNYMVPELWDGKTAERIVKSIKRICYC